jgi:serine/threonine protein kinase
MPTAERYQQYEVLRREDGSLWELGRGAMGITYKAYDTNLRFAVALKIINSAYLESDTARQRFLREARAAAALRHPNVASVFNLGTDQDSYFYVMEFIDGETLEARVRRNGPLKPDETLNIALQVARALAVAAKQQLVHRDLKPTNLMLVDEEGELTVKVIDFGLAKVPKDAGEDSGALTMGGFVGTPHFASPEQVEEGDVDVRSDIYSLGATLYFVLTGQSPFSGSIGQIMSQHLYKPLPMQPLTGLPVCVASLVQHMMQKDRTVRPQSPQELQKAIIACLDEIRGVPVAGVQNASETAISSETVDLTFAFGQSLATGVTVAQTYRLGEELVETSYGRRFVADDLRNNRRVTILALSREFLADASSLSALREAVRLLRNAGHPMLREVYSLDTFPDCSFLVEEYVVGTSLLDLLRRRGALAASEVVRLLNLLAPLADHASRFGLQHVDLTLSGIQLVLRGSSASGTRSEMLLRSVTAWEPLDAKVDAIDFSFSAAHAGTWAGMATRVQEAAPKGPRGSYARLLSLLAYELLGGPRARLETTGQYTPVATLTREGNTVLRRGLVDEFQSAGELSRQLAATVVTSPKLPLPPPSRGSESKASDTPETLQQTPPPKLSHEVPSRRKWPAWIWVLAIGVIAVVGIGVYFFHSHQPMREIAALSVQTDPSGASILLDGKPPQAPSNTFAHVPFGSHQLSATLDRYEPLKQDIQVHQGMSHEVHLQLKPLQEIANLVVQTDPIGASILLDGKPPQVAPNTFTHVPFGPHQLSATLDRYEPLKQDIQVRGGMSPEIHLQLKSIQEMATLAVLTDPFGASILLDGKPPQVLPGTFTHVPFGPHQLSATLENYESLKQDVQVHKGMSSEIHLQLKQIQEIAALTVETEPPNASVLLDGKPAPAPPNTFTHVAFGPHLLSVTLDNYEPFKQEIQVHRGMSSEIRLQLKQIQELPALTIQTEPPDASILLDGKLPQSPPNTFTHVPFGTHQISAVLENYEPFKQDVQVRAGMTPEIHLQLKQIQEIATLTVHAEPPDASLLLDGKSPQVPPNTFTHVSIGAHQLSATLDNYEPIKQDLQVHAGMNPEIRLQLKPSQEVGHEDFAFFLRDAQLGDSTAMMKLGLLYLRRGTPNDEVDGFNWLNRAYNAPNRKLEAGAYVADCYLSGKGTKPDVQKAEEIIMPLANQSVVPAMTLAGRILQYKADLKRTEAAETASLQTQKRIIAQANDLDRQARQWWERAADKEDWNAAAHLGKCYEEGWGGVEKSDEQAEKIYKKGVDHGNALSMLFYGLMIQNKPGRRTEAENSISRAATLGIPSAVKWCKDNNIPFGEKKPTDDQP